MNNNRDTNGSIPEHKGRLRIRINSPTTITHLQGMSDDRKGNRNTLWVDYYICITTISRFLRSAADLGYFGGCSGRLSFSTMHKISETPKLRNVKVSPSTNTQQTQHGIRIFTKLEHLWSRDYPIYDNLWQFWGNGGCTRWSRRRYREEVEGAIQFINIY